MLRKYLNTRNYPFNTSGIFLALTFVAYDGVKKARNKLITRR